jgi:hypothetical protein
MSNSEVRVNIDRDAYDTMVIEIWDGDKMEWRDPDGIEERLMAVETLLLRVWAKLGSPL